MLNVAYGLFLVSGLAVGALYALGGVGLVMLNRATGVLNFAYGAIGALGAMVPGRYCNGVIPNRWRGSPASPSACFSRRATAC